MFQTDMIQNHHRGGHAKMRKVQGAVFAFSSILKWLFWRLRLIPLTKVMQVKIFNLTPNID